MLAYLEIPHLFHVMGTLLFPWGRAYTPILKLGHDDLPNSLLVDANCKLH